MCLNVADFPDGDNVRVKAQGVYNELFLGYIIGRVIAWAGQGMNHVIDYFPALLIDKGKLTRPALNGEYTLIIEDGCH
jgi:hypothetical protein